MASETPILDKIRDFAAGFLKGNTTDLVGAPVDIINELIRPLGLATEKPVGGSKFLREKVTGSAKEGEDNSLAETAGTFLSPGAAAKAMIVGAARLDKLTGTNFVAEAKDLISDRMPRADVYNSTGVYLDRDASLKSAISDRDATINQNAIDKLGYFKPTPLDQIMQHPELYALYPELKDIKVTNMIGPLGSGSYNRAAKHLKVATPTLLGKDPGQVDEIMNRVRSTILHEAQHAVQGIENFAPGGNPQQFLPENFYSIKNKLLDKMRKHSPTSAEGEAANRFFERINEQEVAAVNKYMNIPGEQEARFTQQTRDMSTEQLGAYLLKKLRGGDTPQSWDTRVVTPLVK